MEWSYSGKTGPEFWSSLCTDFQTAEEETQLQSPIPLAESTAHKVSAEGKSLLFTGKKMNVETHFYNHTIHLSPVGNESAAGVEFEGKHYVLEDIHAHLPSEHVIDGTSFDLEIHFVHRSKDNEVVVIGVMGKSTGLDIQSTLYNRYNQFLQEEELNQHHTIELDLERYMPETTAFYHYTGSLTTPPTIGPVQWIVMKEAISLPMEFIEAFKSAIGKTNRPLQAVQDREITLYN